MGNAHRGVYVCLSHRWGSITSSQMTKTATLAAREHGIQLSSLPLTFQDAIKITRSVGLQYIWIDSLCILQDSKADWVEESVKMGTYYSSSWLTIAAGVESCQGLFGVRRFDTDLLQYLKVDFFRPGNSTLYFINLPVNWHVVGDEQKSILRKRAWAFQEELLSPRYLGFQENQIFYRYSEYIHFEDGSKEWLWSPQAPKRSQGEYPLDQRLLEQDWLDFIIQDYSSRHLTLDSDRLPALSGVAHEFQRIQGGHYLAGLWRRDLPRDLCWSKEFATGSCIKPIQYRAPSWSWAAIGGRVVQVSLNRCAIEADIIHVSVEPKGLDPMGEVIGGTLVICGVLRRDLVSKKRERPLYDKDRSITLYDFYLLSSNEDATSDITYKFVPDTSDFSTSTTALWLFFITPQVGLALLPVSSSHPQTSANSFERVGLIELDKKGSSEYSAANLQDEKFRTTINIV